MGRFKGRSAVACTACHSQKLKCDGAFPCERCIRRERECVYPAKKKEEFITVPQSYILGLERAVASGTGPMDAVPDSTASGTSATTEVVSQWGDAMATTAVMTDDYGAERFVYDLKDMSLSIDAHENAERQGNYTYIVLKSDLTEPSMMIKLPTAPMAFQYLGIFEEIFCDYHWFLRRDFRDRLSLLYSDLETQTKDRNWLCRLSLVFALAATVVYGPSIPGDSDEQQQLTIPINNDESAAVPPGADLFEQAVLLQRASSEEPVTEDVEVSNLMAFYCYSLNRRRTAYTHANHSVALSKLLRLEKPPSQPSEPQSPMLREHRKRLWWTSFCMERMMSAELGLLPTRAASPTEIALPSTIGSLSDDAEQFFDPNILSLQSRICEIRCRITDALSRLQGLSDENTMFHHLWHCSDTLRKWRDSIPSYMAYEFRDGVPPDMHRIPCARGVASLYLRYHQCYIILSRPFYSQELSVILRSGGRLGNQVERGPGTTSMEGIRRLKLQSLQAARSNCRILIDLFNRGKHARFGYWDSVHAFSSLSIISLSRVLVSNNAEGGWSDSNDDGYLYSHCRTMLNEMAGAGNPAARDHDALLTDVEDIVESLTDHSHQPPSESLGEPMVNGPFQQEFGEQFCQWSDRDWADFLDTCSGWM